MNLRIKLLVDYYFGELAHAFLKPFVIVLGKIMRRDHSLKSFNEIVILKLLGGGSLIIAYPSLVALKQMHPSMKFTLVTTSAINPFAKMIGLFDKIILIRDDSVLHIAYDSLLAVCKLWQSKVIVDLEIHSRLSSIFSLLT